MNYTMDWGMSWACEPEAPKATTTDGLGRCWLGRCWRPGLGVFNEQRLPNPCWLMICLAFSDSFFLLSLKTSKNKNLGIFLIRELGISFGSHWKIPLELYRWSFVPGAVGGWVSELLLLRQLGVQGLDAHFLGDQMLPVASGPRIPSKCRGNDWHNMTKTWQNMAKSVR